MDDGIQNSTQSENDISIKEFDVDVKLTPVQRAMIDYKALNGLVVNDDADGGKMFRKMTVTELAQSLGVTRDALYKAMNNLPNFWYLVSERRKELGSQTRLAAIHEVWFLKAAAGSFPHLQLYLANFDPNFKMPQQKMEHELGGGFADLLNRARQDRLKQDQPVIEAEVTSEPSTEDQRTDQAS